MTLRRGDDPGLSTWAQCNQSGSLKGKRERCEDSRNWSELIVGIEEDGDSVHRLRNAGILEAEVDKKWILP